MLSNDVEISDDLRTFKDYLVRERTKISGLRRMFGNIVRERFLCKGKRAHGSEIESVSMRNELRLNVSLCGLPPTAFGVGTFARGFGHSAVEEWPHELNPYVIGFEKTLIEDGQVKLGLVLSSVWQWDQILVYVGASPGNNLAYLCQLRGFRKRALVCVDPRPLGEGVKDRIVKKGWTVRLVKGCIPGMNREVTNAVMKVMASTGLSKVLIFSDIRSDEAAEGYRSTGCGDAVLSEDMSALTWLELLRRSIAAKSVLSEISVVTKVKVVHGGVRFSFCSCATLFTQFSRRNVWELRGYYPADCVLRGHLTLTRNDLNTKLKVEKMLIAWNSLSVRVRSWQPYYMTCVGIERHDCLQGGSREKDGNVDLFYITNKGNVAKLREIVDRGFLSSSLCLSLWLGGGSNYGDAAFFPDLGVLLETSMSGRMVFIKGHQLHLLLSNGISSMSAMWDDNFVFILDSHALTGDELELMSNNTFVNCQTFGFRAGMNGLRASGDDVLLTIDAFRDKWNSARYSGHLLGMILLMLRGVEFYDVVRWVKLVYRNYLTYGYSGTDDRHIDTIESYKRLDERPECRGDATLWHTDVHLHNSAILLWELRVIDDKILELMLEMLNVNYPSCWGTAGRSLVARYDGDWLETERIVHVSSNSTWIQPFLDLFGYGLTLDLMELLGGSITMSQLRGLSPDDCDYLEIQMRAVRQMDKSIAFCLARGKLILIGSDFEWDLLQLCLEGAVDQPEFMAPVSNISVLLSSLQLTDYYRLGRMQIA